MLKKQDNFIVFLAIGRLKAGDQVLRVNGNSLEKVSYSEALQVLREAAASGNNNGLDLPVPMVFWNTFKLSGRCEGVK